MQTKQNDISKIFILIASMLLSLYLLRYASDIIVPFLISLAIAIILSPLFSYLEKKHIPRVISLISIIMLFSIPIVIVAGYVGNEAKEFALNYHTIKAEFLNATNDMVDKLKGYGLVISKDKIDYIFQHNNMTNILKKLATQANNQFSNMFFILLMVSFMLMESEYFYQKLLKIEKENDIDKDVVLEIIEKIKAYFALKVKTSMLTATLVFFVLWYYNIHYYALLALLAFFLNFIPVIGSIFAAVPAILLAFIQEGAITMFWVSFFYLLINISIGNILEPKIMGKGFGLSPLVILLGMNFWGWMFGPTGMILSVPLTMITQYIFGVYHQTKWISVLLSDYGAKK